MPGSSVPCQRGGGALEELCPEGQLPPGRARSSDGSLWDASPVGPLQAHRAFILLRIISNTFAIWAKT